MSGLFFTDLPELADEALKDAPGAYKHLAADSREERAYYHHWYEDDYAHVAWDSVLSPHESAKTAAMEKLIAKRDQVATEWALYKEWLAKMAGFYGGYEELYEETTPRDRLEAYFAEQRQEALR